MGYYKNQPVRYIVGDALTTPTLTASFNDNSFTGWAGALSALTLYIEYTPVEAASSLQMQLEYGPDIGNLFVEGALLDTDTSGVSQIKAHTYNMDGGAGGVTIKRRVAFDVADDQVRLSFKETPAGAFGTIRIILLRGEE